jgi:hypothetical protein
MKNTVIDKQMRVVVSGIDEIRMRLPDPRRYPNAIALLRTESERLHAIHAPGVNDWAATKARELEAALRVLGGELPT